MSEDERDWPLRDYLFRKDRKPDRAAAIYWARLRGDTFVAIGKVHGISRTSASQIFKREGHRRLRERLRREMEALTPLLTREGAYRLVRAEYGVVAPLRGLEVPDARRYVYDY